MTRKKINKDTMIRFIHDKKFIMVLVVIIFISAFFCYFYRKQKIIFTIHDKEADTLEIKMAYGEEILPSAEVFSLKAYTDGRDITSDLIFSKDTFKEVGEYEISFQLEPEAKKSYKLKLIIQDEKAPVIVGPSKINWELHKVFNDDPSSLGISVSDNHDNNLIESLRYEGEVDVEVEGDYELRYEACDTSDNCATHKLMVHVKKTEMIMDELYQDPRMIAPNIVKNPNDVTSLVNKYNALPTDYAPSDLVSVTSNNGRAMSLRKEAALHWERLNADAKASNITIYMVSSYRTKQYQGSLFDNYFAVDGSNAFLYSALPRRSEHELGLAIDVSYDGSLHQDLLNSSVGAFMNDHGYKYGFIMRYPDDKVNITKYGFEAWHYRYVGVELATLLKSQNITLEEYYE